MTPLIVRKRLVGLFPLIYDRKHKLCPVCGTEWNWRYNVPYPQYNGITINVNISSCPHAKQDWHLEQRDEWLSATKSRDDLN